MKITLHVWRQKNRETRGRMISYALDGISPNESFLEMLDKLN